MKKACILLLLVVLTGCGVSEDAIDHSSNIEGIKKMDSENDRQKILQIIDTYVKAVNTADADLLESLFWKDDLRFSEVENHIPTPFGAKTFSDLNDWICKNGKSGNNQRFYDTIMHMLSPKIAYSVSMRDEYYDDMPSSSRVTFVYLKKGDEWKIIHGHFSNVPK